MKETKIRKKINFNPHPNVIFATKVEKGQTKSGIILPEGSEKGTPIAEIRAIGENIKSQFENTEFSIEVGDYVYVDGSYIRPAILDGVEGVILMADGIFGKVPMEENND